MDDWRPIETAPLDTDVLLWIPGEDMGITVGEKWEGSKHWIPQAELMDRPPTHWQPLPPPPSVVEAPGG